MLFAEHTVRTGVLCRIICVRVIKITLIWGELSTLPFPSIQQLPRLFSDFFFFLSQKGFIFFTVSRNFHYTVMPLHCSALIILAISRSVLTFTMERNCLRGFAAWVLVPEQTSLESLLSPREEQLTKEVQSGSWRAHRSYPYHRQCRCHLSGGCLGMLAPTSAGVEIYLHHFWWYSCCAMERWDVETAQSPSRNSALECLRTEHNLSVSVIYQLAQNSALCTAWCGFILSDVCSLGHHSTKRA